MLNRFIIQCLLVVALCLCSVAAMAEWSTNPYENNAVDTQLEGAEIVKSVSDGSGGSLVFFSQFPSVDDNYNDVWAQRIDQNGNLVWGAPVLVRDCNNSAVYLAHEVISDGVGGAFLAMIITSGGFYRVFVQHVDSNGANSWTSGGIQAVTSVTNYHMYTPHLALDGSGGVIVAWEDLRNSVSTGYDIWAQRLDGSGALQWGSAGLLVSGAASSQRDISMVADGTGGVFLAWEDGRSGTNFDIYGQHIWADGASQWAANGKGLQTLAGDDTDPVIAAAAPSSGIILAFERYIAPEYQIVVSRFSESSAYMWSDYAAFNVAGNQHNPEIVADGLGGSFVTWTDYRPSGYTGNHMYIQSISPGGSPRWSATGVAAGLGNGTQDGYSLIIDGFGGVMAVWSDERNGDDDIFGQRFNQLGTRMWDDYGLLIGGEIGTDYLPVAHSDGKNGLVVTWKNRGPDFQDDVYAQRVGYHGKLGYANPEITGVNDHPQDQGGVVLLDWTRSYLDHLAHLEVGYYTLWRRYASAGKIAPLGGPDLEGEIKRLGKMTGLDSVVLRNQLKAGWAMIDQVDAFQRDEYTYNAPTHADSSGSGVPLTEFQVLAHQSSTIYWESNIVAGYSVDNLAPGTPKTLIAIYLNPDGVLDWSPSTVSVPDLAGYRVYRSGMPGFTPGPGNFVDSTPDTTFVDGSLASGIWYYLVTAEDHHDNESLPSNQAELQVAVSGVDDDTPLAFRMTGAVPNPFNPATMIRFSLAQGGHTTLEVFDTRGRLVRRLLDESMGAGPHEAVWDGRDDQGRGLPSGVYLAQVRSGSERGITKMILAK